MSKHTEERTGVVYRTEAELIDVTAYGRPQGYTLSRYWYAAVAGHDMVTVYVPTVAELPAIGSLVTFTVTRGDND